MESTLIPRRSYTVRNLESEQKRSVKSYASSTYSCVGLQAVWKCIRRRMPEGDTRVEISVAGFPAETLRRAETLYIIENVYVTFKVQVTRASCFTS